MYNQELNFHIMNLLKILKNHYLEKLIKVPMIILFTVLIF